MHCAIHCADHRFCAAINYKEKTDGIEPNCQLTNTTEQKFDNNASKTKRVWTFMKFNVDRNQAVRREFLIHFPNIPNQYIGPYI